MLRTYETFTRTYMQEAHTALFMVSRDRNLKDAELLAILSVVGWSSWAESMHSGLSDAVVYTTCG